MSKACPARHVALVTLHVGGTFCDLGVAEPQVAVAFLAGQLLQLLTVLPLLATLLQQVISHVVEDCFIGCAWVRGVSVEEFGLATEFELATWVNHGHGGSDGPPEVVFYFASLYCHGEFGMFQAIALIDGHVPIVRLAVPKPLFRMRGCHAEPEAHLCRLHCFKAQLRAGPEDQAAELGRTARSAWQAARCLLHTVS